MKVKVLDRDLIRTFGGTIIEMNESQARRYTASKQVIEYIEPLKANRFSNKRVNAPERNKMVWTPPEQKVFESNNEKNEKSDDGTFPGPDDGLFPQINK